MLYIEDFLELIEPFPQEIRERLTEMREIDLHIQNETDKLDERIDTFFHHCKKQKTDWKAENFESIKKEYSKLLESADDKVQIANQLYDLIEKYLKKLDKELEKFKLELEADHAGITSKLEQVISKNNSNELNSQNGLNSTSSNCLNFNSNTDDSDFTLCSSSTNDLLMLMLNNNSSTNTSILNDHSLLNNSATTSSHKRKHSILNEKTYLNQFNTSNNNVGLVNSNRDDEDSSSSWNSRLDLTVNNIVSNSNAVFHTTNRKNALINSRANVVNNRRSSQKRKIRTDKPPLIKKSRLFSDMSTYDDESFVDDENARNDFLQSDDNNETGDDEMNEEAGSEIMSENGLNGAAGGGGGGEEDSDNVLTTSDEEASTEFDSVKLKLKHGASGGRHQRPAFKEDWNSSEDTNERYCICKDVSYGDMICCDNTRCDTQWFHFVCVGLNSAPKGKWFCPTCVEIRTKRREKQLNSILSVTSANASASTSTNTLLLNTYSNQNDLTNSQFSSTTSTNNPNHNQFLTSSSSLSSNDKKF